MPEVLPDGGDHGVAGAGESAGAGDGGAEPLAGGLGTELLGAAEGETLVEMGVHEAFLSLASM